jgi:hypothetical protein
MEGIALYCTVKVGRLKFNPAKIQRFVSIWFSSILLRVWLEVPAVYSTEKGFL